MLRIEINKNLLNFNGRQFHTRSTGLIKFIALLAWRSRKATSSWCGLVDLGAALGSVHPRQIQRFLDALAAADLPIVDFESRTRGRWRIASSLLEEVSLDLDDAQLRRYLNLDVPDGKNKQIDWQEFDKRLSVMT